MLTILFTSILNSIFILILSYLNIELQEKYDILLQEINDRNTIRGGTTLGPMIGSHLPMMGCDLGIPMLAMHSARETMAMEDYISLCRLVTAFFTE